MCMEPNQDIVSASMSGIRKFKSGKLTYRPSLNVDTLLGEPSGVYLLTSNVVLEYLGPE